MKSVNKSKLIKFLVILAAIFLLIFFNFRGWLSFPKNLTYWVSYPFLKLFQTVDNKIASTWHFWVTLKDLNKENAELKSANQLMWQQNAQLKEMARENEALRQQLGLGQLTKQRLIMANVVGYSPSLGQYFLVDKGSNEGVVLDSAVVAANNFLVGRVVEVNKNYSKVLLLSDSNSLVNVVAQDSRVSGLVRGSHGLVLNLEMVPIDAALKSGETVLTSGLNDEIPKGLIVGQVAEVVKKENEIWQQVTIQPAVDFKKIEQVFILLR